LNDDSGLIDCAVYRPTGSLAMAARDLLPGDKVRVCGGVRGLRHGRPTLNVEKLEVLHLVDKIEYSNPLCGKCGARCESMGQGQGLRCKKCRQRNDSATKIELRQQRRIQPRVYCPPPRTRRHLAMPDSRPRIFQSLEGVEEFQVLAEDYS
jgi:tRNA(Ile2)-agmatinylcytidine synthase